MPASQFWAEYPLRVIARLSRAHRVLWCRVRLCWTHPQCELFVLAQRPRRHHQRWALCRGRQTRPHRGQLAAGEPIHDPPRDGLRCTGQVTGQYEHGDIDEERRGDPPPREGQPKPGLRLHRRPGNRRTNSSTKHSAGHQQRGRILAIAVHMWILQVCWLLHII